MKENSCTTDSRKATISINENYLLTIKEASEYFNIGIKNMRRLAEENKGFYVIFLGNRQRYPVHGIVRQPQTNYPCRV